MKVMKMNVKSNLLVASDPVADGVYDPRNDD